VGAWCSFGVGLWCTFGGGQSRTGPKGQSPKAPALEVGRSILLVFGLLKPRKSFSERHILLDGAPSLPI
jgi:hypothetical protein